MLRDRPDDYREGTAVDYCMTALTTETLPVNKLMWVRSVWTGTRSGEQSRGKDLVKMSLNFVSSFPVFTHLFFSLSQALFL
jgi:hypothetical protein